MSARKSTKRTQKRTAPTLGQMQQFILIVDRAADGRIERITLRRTNQVKLDKVVSFYRHRGIPIIDGTKK